MTQEVKPHIAHLRTNLFTRIMLRLSIPLLILGALFIGIHLTTQIGTLNEIQKFESRWAVQGVQANLIKLFQEQDPLENLDTLETQLKNWQKLYRFEDINIWNVFEKKALFENNSQLAWTEQDNLAINESLHQQSIGNPYLIRVERIRGKIFAYIPIEQITANPDAALGKQFFVARIAFSLVNLEKSFQSSRQTLIFIFIFVILTGAVIGRSLAKSIIQPIKKLNRATHEIMKGNLNLRVDVRTGDELETLAETFNHMIDAMKEIKERASDANPLTQLPGNQAIYHEIKKRTFERQKFVFFHADLNHFKVFNDHFGLARGDQAIIKTAEILKKVTKQYGSPDDFVGHQGGDDFVIITKPNHAKQIGQEVCRIFDIEARNALYRKEDLDAGFTLHIDRRGGEESGKEEVKKFHLLSIALAGVSNAKKDIADYFNCMTLAADAKKAVKQFAESTYIIQE